MSSSGSTAKAAGDVQDWYTALGLPVGAAEEEVDRAIERRSRQASVLANTAPERSQQMRDTIRAMRADLLSGREARQHYDQRLANSQPVIELTVGATPSAATPSIDPVARPQVVDALVANIAPLASRFRRFLQSGWTCPSCGHEGGPADRFCMKCGAPMRPESTTIPSKCTHCATRLAAGDRFCDRCGSPVQ